MSKELFNALHESQCDSVGMTLPDLVKVWFESNGLGHNHLRPGTPEFAHFILGSGSPTQSALRFMSAQDLATFVQIATRARDTYLALVESSNTACLISQTLERVWDRKGGELLTTAQAEPAVPAEAPGPFSQMTDAQQAHINEPLPL